MSLFKKNDYFFMTLPAIILFAIFVLIPTLISFFYSVTDWSGLGNVYNLVGLDNYKRMFTDERLIIAVKNTFFIAFLSTITQNVYGLFLALILDKIVKFKKLMRTVFFLPFILNAVVVSFIWQFLLSPNNGINAFLDKIGLESLKMDWLGDHHIVLYSILVVGLWQYTGSTMIIYLASLQGVPQELYEAGYLDGVNIWTKFWHITFPLIAPAFTINIILCVIGGLKLFDLVFILTSGGPGYASETISTTMLFNAFYSDRWGYGSAIAVSLFFVVLIISMAQLKFLRNREVEM